MAVGECVQHRGLCYGLVAPLWDMCRALADHATGNPSGYEGSVTSTKLKVSGIDVATREVFAPDDAVVDELRVDHGDLVEAGRVLAILRNPQLDLEFRLGNDRRLLF